MRSAIVTLLILLLSGALLRSSARADEGPVAEPPPKTKEEKVRELLALPGMAHERLATALERLLRDVYLTPELRDKMKELYDEAELLDRVVALYVGQIEETLIDALLAFYATEDGRRIRRLTPWLLGSLDHVEETWSRALTKRALDALWADGAPAGLPPEPGVVVGKDYLEKDLFADWQEFGDVTDIRRGDLDPREGLEIGVVGEGAAIVADDETREEVLFQVEFPSPLRRPVLVDADFDFGLDFAERDGGDEFAYVVASSRRARDAGALELIDQRGRVRWAYGGTPPALSMAAGDLEFGSDMEFVVGFADGGGLHLIERDGEVLWTMPDRGIRHVEVAHLEGGVRPEIVHTDVNGRLTIRDHTGRVRRRIRPPRPVTRFAVARWPTREDAPRILVWDGRGNVTLLDPRGRAVHELVLPEGPRAASIAAVPVAFRAGEPASFALLIRYGLPGRSTLLRETPGALCVFDGQGTLAFHEVLGAVGGALAAIPQGTDDADEVLLVGGRHRVWSYVRPAKPEPPGEETAPAVVPAPESLPHAGKVARVLLQAVEGLPARVLRLRVTPGRASMRIETRDPGVPHAVVERLGRDVYLLHRVRDTARPVEQGPQVLEGATIRQDFVLRLDPLGVIPRPAHRAPHIDRAFLASCFEAAGCRGTPTSGERARRRGDHGFRLVEQAFDLECTEPMTSARLLALVDVIQETDTWRVTTLVWDRDGHPAGPARCPRITVSSWTPFRR